MTFLPEFMGKIVFIKSYTEFLSLFFPYFKEILVFTFTWILNPFTILGVLLLVIAYFVVKFLLIRKLVNEPFVIFEVIPLQTTEQSAFSSSQFFNFIHGLSRGDSTLYGLFGIKNEYAFEIISTKEDGIRYLIKIPTEASLIFKKNLLSYLPGTQVKEVSDYVSRDNTYSQVIEFKLSNHFAFPLRKQTKLEEYDPIAYITGSMTKLNKNEMVVFQILTSPIKKSEKKDIGKISNLIYSNRDLVSSLKDMRPQGMITDFLKFIAINLLRILTLPIGLLVFLTTDGRDGPFLRLPHVSPPEKTNNLYQEELERSIKGKLDQELFNVTLRLYVEANGSREIKRIASGFISIITSYGNSNNQSFAVKKLLNFSKFKELFNWAFSKRLSLLPSNVILSASEVSDLYHLPYTSTTKTENIVKLMSRELPAPLSLKKRGKLDLFFAVNEYGGSVTQIGLTKEERRTHMYIIGATGTGKSTLLLSMADQDIKKGNGLCVIDPHGDLIEKILPLIPENRIKDVVYFNPDDIGFPMGINLLELSTGLSNDDALREKEFITESIISLFHKLYPDKYSGPRMEYILRNAIHTAFTTPNPTLFTVYKLLINDKYRNFIVKNLTDTNLKDFWEFEFKKAGDYQKVKMISPITNKIGRFLFSPTAKRILEQEKSTVNFDDIMDSGKILLCNLSKGRVGEDNSEVFGIVIMTKIQLAALKRARVDIEDRRDFYLYVDEFQNFATPAFAQILSEARKYRLSAILAHQTTSQVEDPNLVQITLANTGTVICFRTGSPIDEKLILPQFRPYINIGEIANLPSYHFYMKKSGITSEEPFSGITTPISVKPNKITVEAVITSSRKLYAKPYVSKKEDVFIGKSEVKKVSNDEKNIVNILP